MCVCVPVISALYYQLLVALIHLSIPLHHLLPHPVDEMGVLCQWALLSGCSDTTTSWDFFFSFTSFISLLSILNSRPWKQNQNMIHLVEQRCYFFSRVHLLIKTGQDLYQTCYFFNHIYLILFLTFSALPSHLILWSFSVAALCGPCLNLKVLDILPPPPPLVPFSSTLESLTWRCSAD